MQAVSKITDQKITILICGLGLMICIIIGRLSYLQIHLNDQLKQQSQKNFLRFETIRPARGNIIDVHGNLLATNRPVHNLVWCGSGQHLFDALQQDTLEKLAFILGFSQDEMNSFTHEIQRAERYQKRITLAQDISFDKVCQIEELFSGCKQLCIETDFQRLYPHETCASHILGYLGNIKVEPAGKMGIEQAFEHELRGTHGIKQKTINSLGRSLAVQTLQEALAGNDIQTTIDLNLQKIIEAIFPQEYKGTCIIMNPCDGSLVALMSRPHFDPNTFLTPILPEKWQSMQDGQLFLNRAFNACYPPGSIFKLVTMAAALHENIVTPNTCWECKGFITFSKRKYLCQCTKTWGRSVLTAQQALARSCNTFFYEIGKKIPIDTLASYAREFGLGQKTTSHFPEKAGLIPTNQWKLQTKGERWWPGETLSATIGQSFILVTPIQIARMIASIFTGYLVNPRIVINEPVVQQPLAIDQETLSFLQDSMKAVVTQGTGQKINRIKDLEIYAKTSTAQTSGLDKRNLGSEYLEHAWFVAYFKYKEEQPLVLVLLIEHAGSSRVTAQIAKKFLLEYKRFIDTRH